MCLRDGEPLDTSMHVRRARDGRVASVEWLVRRLAPVLLTQTELAIPDELRRHVDADDLVSEAWMIVIANLDNIRPRNGRFTPPLLSYFSSVVRNKVKTLGRDWGRRPPAVASFDGQAESSGRASDPLRRLIHGERQSVLYEALCRLEPEDCAILVLRGIERRSVAEVAAFLDMRPNSVTVKYLRLLARLRARFRGSVLDELDER